MIKTRSQDTIIYYSPKFPIRNKIGFFLDLFPESWLSYRGLFQRIISNFEGKLPKGSSRLITVPDGIR